MRRFWWISLIRGIIALIIGILIFVWPHIAQTMFANFFALYLLSSGFLDLRVERTVHQKKRLWLLVSLLQIVAGAAILLRFVYMRYLAPGLAIKFFGLVALFVGLICFFGRSTNKEATREQLFGQLLMGFFEVGLGLILFFLDEMEPFTKLFAGGWAFVGGILFILQSLQTRREILTLPGA